MDEVVDELCEQESALPEPGERREKALQKAQEAFSLHTRLKSKILRERHVAVRTVSVAVGQAACE